MEHEKRKKFQSNILLNAFENEVATKREKKLLDSCQGSAEINERAIHFYWDLFGGSLTLTLRLYQWRHSLTHWIHYLDNIICVVIYDVFLTSSLFLPPFRLSILFLPEISNRTFIELIRVWKFSIHAICKGSFFFFFFTLKKSCIYKPVTASVSLFALLF